MLTFAEALIIGFTLDEFGCRTFSWKDGENTYELMFEPLLFDNQYYVALYKNRDLMTEKVVVKPGYEKSQY